MKSQSSSDYQSKVTDVSPLEVLIAGSISGGIARACTAPLDTIKIRLQLHTGKSSAAAFDVMKDILQHEGITGLWKGNVPAEILYVAYGAVQFSSYSAFNRCIHAMEVTYGIKIGSEFQSFASGLGAGVVGTTLTYPFDYLRTHFAANTTKESLKMKATLKRIIQQEGVLGVYAGYRPTLLSVATGTGILFWSYETLRRHIRQYNIPFGDAMSGFFAGGVSKGLTFPLDTVRKRTQMYTSMHRGVAKISSYELFRKILASEGKMVFYKGFAVSILKTAPTSAISLSSYQFVVDILQRIQGKVKRL